MNRALRTKIESTFGNLVVDKRQALQAGLELMPRFVTEFLLAKARQDNATLSLHEVRDRIRQFSVDADRKEEFKSRLMRHGQAVLIGLLEVEARLERRVHLGRIAQLAPMEIAVPDSLIEKHPELLYGGLWGSCLLTYDERAKPQVLASQFEPYQLTRPDMAAFREARAQFTFEEWLDLLITSAGYRPEGFSSLRHKLLLLARLVPLVQGNVNIVEFGPRGTGKSYLLRNLSPRVHLLAGARATPATLLYDLNRNQVGIVGRKKVVVFDEIGATSFPDRSLVAALKTYMQDGLIERSGKSLTSDCSFMWTGNLETDADGMPRRDYQHLLEELPRELCDVAIADRLHGFLPGWELPKISDDVLADGVGFLSDYFGEVLCHLRGDLTFQDWLKTFVVLDVATTRDATAIHRMAAGLLKMLFPDHTIPKNEAAQVLQVAVELRQRIHNQMVRMAPGEFQPKVIAFPGMKLHPAPDLSAALDLQRQDVAANQRALVGKITILTVGDKGGGDVGFVECAQVPGKDVEVIGLRGRSRSQSVRAAYNALLHLAPKLGIPIERILNQKLSLHLVNMAQPKDGRSAGVAFALAMLSAVTGRAIKPALAVTGDLSLHGNINEVGGLPEKLSAAHRHGRKTVLIPASNAAEALKVPSLNKVLDIRAVHTLAEAVELALEPSSLSR